MFTQATPQQKRNKIFVYSGPGLFKTRTMLRLGSGPAGEAPTLAVIDNEQGTDHYAAEFNFLREQNVEPDMQMQSVKALVGNPGSIKTLGFDTFSVYYEALTSKYVDLYHKRELRSAGHKQEYYVLQPRDYNPINREASKMVRLLLKSDLNIICLCQQKDVWGEDMKVVGTTFDGWKRLAYYFDTVLEIVPKDKKKLEYLCYVHKDRSNHLEKFKSYSWDDDVANCAWLTKAGFNLTGGPAAESFVDTEPAAFEPVAEQPQQPLKLVDPSVQQLADDPAPQSVGASAATKEHPAPDALEKSAAAVAHLKDDLLHEVVQLKQACSINGAEWPRYIKPFKVSTAKDMTNSQLMELICTLKEVKNAPARTAA